MPKKKLTIEEVLTSEGLREFAEIYKKLTGFHPVNQEEIVEEAIELYNKKQKEGQ